MTAILVVDDSAVDRLFVGELLRKQSGWVVDAAENGSAALAKMRIALPDVVVTDLQMPLMDGLELVGNVRELPGRARHSHDGPRQRIACGRGFGRAPPATSPSRNWWSAWPTRSSRCCRWHGANRSHRRLLGSMIQAEFHFSLETTRR